jgi:hypothetical protein
MTITIKQNLPKINDNESYRKESDKCGYHVQERLDLKRLQNAT